MKLRPQEIRALTLPELLLVLDDDLEKPRPPGGAPVMSHEEVIQRAERWRALSPAQKLQEARGW